jgi:SAM-dependent methyltransferase
VKPQLCEYFFAHELRGRLERVIDAALDVVESNGVLRSEPTQLDHPTLEADGFVVDRVFDEHVTVSHPDLPESRRVAERGLFDTLAEHYESRIDIRRNRAMIALLLDQVDGPRVLDFGCGTGLSIALARERHLEVMGFDVSEEMTSIARSRGMVTVSLTDLQTAPAQPFDGLIASYVMHLASAIDEFAVAVRRVRVAGKVAANFHKERGFAATSRLLLDSGFTLDSSDGHWGSTVGVWTRTARPTM